MKQKHYHYDLRQTYHPILPDRRLGPRRLCPLCRFMFRRVESSRLADPPSPAAVQQARSPALGRAPGARREARGETRIPAEAPLRD